MFQDLDSTLNSMLSDPNDPATPADLRNADKLVYPFVSELIFIEQMIRDVKNL